MPIILIALLVTSVHATTLEVERNLLSYKLDYNQTLLSIHASGMNLALRRSSCNESLVKKFETLVDRSLSSGVKLVQPLKHAVKVQRESELFYLNENSKNANVLINLPHTFRQLKLSAEKKCLK